MTQPRTQDQSEPDKGLHQHREDDVAPILPEEAMSDADFEADTEGMVEDSIELSVEAADLLSQLESERDEATASRMRVLADMANLEKRSRREQQRALQEGAVRVVGSLLSALDNFDLSLNQDPASMTAEQYIDGIRLVHDEVVRALETHGLTRIVPEEGVPFDPERHEAMFRRETEGAAPNTIVAVLQPGYALGECVLRPAKVAVSQGESS